MMCEPKEEYCGNCGHEYSEHYQNDKEFWFEISLGDIKKITNKSITNINIKLADT